MTSGAKNIAKDFTHLTEMVFAKSPILKENFEKNGKKTLFEHAQSYRENKLSVSALARRPELVSAVSARAIKIFGEEIAHSIAKQLEKNFFVSTADHHGMICHPFSLSANLIGATQASALENLLVFSCGNVSLNNSSFPKGLIFHSDSHDYRAIQQLSFFPASENQRPVLGVQGYTIKDIARVKRNLWSMVKSKTVRMEVAEKITETIDGVYAKPNILGIESFSNQVSLTNMSLWQKFFSTNQTAPRLVYIDQESLVSDLLLSHHLFKETMISRIIFDETVASIFSKHFDGIRGGFSKKEKKGSYLFWAIPEGAKYRQQLWLEGCELVSADGSCRIPLEAEAIAEKLESGELVPSMLLTFLVLSFYYGLKCLGGFLQPSYLTAMKHAYSQTLRDMGAKEEIEVFANTDTKAMGGDLALAFLQDKNKQLHQATGLDLILYGDTNVWSKLVDLSKHMTVEESVAVMMPLFYSVLYQGEEVEKSLVNINVEGIIKLVGLDKKIKPCVSM
jgi:hypothetical protein